MAAFVLESLVLRGVAILRDELAVNSRLGTGKAKETPEIPFSMRHPLASVQVYPQPAGRYSDADADPSADDVLGAGRSRSCAGVLGRSARTAEPAIRFGWSTSRGGSASAAVTGSGRLTTFTVASVSEEASRQLPSRHPSSCSRGPSAVAMQGLMQVGETTRWCKPEGRMPTASTEGKEV